MVRRFETRERRRGVAVVIVLALIAVTMGLAYASLRVQVNAQQLQANSGRRSTAREAARSGAIAALRKMHQVDWAGVGTTFSAALSETDRFECLYSVGDPALVSGDAKYAEYPYRVTLDVTGYSTDPASGARATHRMRVVVMLNPRALSAAPTDWSYVQTYTVCQRRDDASFKVHMPFQMQGTTRIQRKLELNKDYTRFDDAAASYFNGISAIFLQGSDCRPFTGAIHWKTADQAPEERTWLTTNLGLTAVDTAKRDIAAWSSIAPNATYKLYPGGATYNVTPISADIAAGTTLDASVTTNPLGICYRNGPVRLNSNVTIKGALIADGVGSTVTIAGTNVLLQAIDAPALYGTTATVRIPTLIATNFSQSAGAGATVNGFAYVEENFDIAADTQLETFSLTGKLVARKIEIKPRTQWNAVDWKNAALIWNLLPVGKALFPIYMDVVWNVKKEPLIVLKPNATPRTYHWLTRGTPLYAIGSGDAGLCWDVVRWQESL